MSASTTFTTAELVDCARRELSQRRRVYARIVASGKMTRAAADRQIAMMAEIARILEERDGKERLL